MEITLIWKNLSKLSWISIVFWKTLSKLVKIADLITKAVISKGLINKET